MPTEKTTNILGYFNPNTYPLLIEVNALNLRMTLAPKQPLLISGQRVNDPVLQQVCRPKGLAVEMAKGPVPILFLQRPAPVAPSAGFSGQVNKPSDLESKLGSRNVPRSITAEEGVKLRPPANPVSSQFTASGNPVSGMSMEEARKRGLVQNTTKPREGPDDTSGSPLRGEQIPQISFPMDPKLAKHLQGKQSAMVEQGANIRTNATTEIEESTTAADVPTLDVASLTRKMLEETSAPVPEEPAAEVIASSAPASAPAVAPSASTVPLISPDITSLLDQAQETLDKTVPPPPPPPAKKLDFVCPFDGVAFEYRSWLIRHVKKKFPDKLAEVEAMYPKTKG